MAPSDTPIVISALAIPAVRAVASPSAAQSLVFSIFWFLLICVVDGLPRPDPDGEACLRFIGPYYNPGYGLSISAVRHGLAQALHTVSERITIIAYDMGITVTDLDHAIEKLRALFGDPTRIKNLPEASLRAAEFQAANLQIERCSIPAPMRTSPGASWANTST